MISINAPRLHELLTLVASAPEGISIEELWKKAYPHAKKRNGASHVLSTFAKRGLVEARGMRYFLTAGGLAFLRGEVDPEPIPEPAAAPASPPPLTPHQLELLRHLSNVGVAVPPPPAPPWVRASDGLEWARGPDGGWWSRDPAGTQPPRTRSPNGACFEVLSGFHVRPRQLDQWFLPLDEAGAPVSDRPVPCEPPAELQPAPAAAAPEWAQSPDGRWWLWWQGTWWTPDIYGTPQPVVW